MFCCFLPSVINTCNIQGVLRMRQREKICREKSENREISTDKRGDYVSAEFANYHWMAKENIAETPGATEWFSSCCRFLLSSLRNFTGTGQTSFHCLLIVSWVATHENQRWKKKRAFCRDRDICEKKKWTRAKTARTAWASSWVLIFCQYKQSSNAKKIAFSGNDKSRRPPKSDKGQLLNIWKQFSRKREHKYPYRTCTQKLNI